MKNSLWVILLILVAIVSFIVGYSLAPTEVDVVRHKTSFQNHSAGKEGPVGAGGYGAPSPPAGGYGSPPAAGGYGAPPPAAGGYGAPAPAAGGYGAPPPAAGGYGAPPPAAGGYGAPPTKGGSGR